MNPGTQVIVVIVGVLLTAFAGVNTYILSDLKADVKGLLERFINHIQDHSIHK